MEEAKNETGSGHKEALNEVPEEEVAEEVLHAAADGVVTEEAEAIGNEEAEAVSFVEEGDHSQTMNLERILDIELPVNISFGTARRPLSEVLKLGPGALLELDRTVDEPVVVKVNNKVLARGEIVDVDGFYGVQITEIANTSDRIASLGGEA